MINTAQADQMELGFETRANHASQNNRTQSRSKWWFAQMRRVVDLAMEWKPVAEGRPEQVYFSLSPSPKRS